jgi:hypothetical protein
MRDAVDSVVPRAEEERDEFLPRDLLSSANSGHSEEENASTSAQREPRS